MVGCAVAGTGLHPLCKPIVHTLQLGNAGIQRHQPKLCALLHCSHPLLVVMREREQIENLLQGEARIYGPAVKAQLRDRSIPTTSIARGTSRWLGQQPQAFVITNRVDRHADALGDGTDGEWSTLCVHAASLGL
ncbi:hypothetical protein TX25_28380 [Pseudomonas lactis]|nr:hypothetical protein TX25_28380 [Pseudomonas lactis]